MTVQDTVRTVHVPHPAGPADPPLAGPPPTAAADPARPTAPQLGRDRPLTAEEREFVVSLGFLLLVLEVFIVTGLLLSHYVWS